MTDDIIALKQPSHAPDELSQKKVRKREGRITIGYHFQQWKKMMKKLNISNHVAMMSHVLQVHDKNCHLCQIYSPLNKNKPFAHDADTLSQNKGQTLHHNLKDVDKHTGNHLNSPVVQSGSLQYIPSILQTVQQNTHPAAMISSELQRSPLTSINTTAISKSRSLQNIQPIFSSHSQVYSVGETGGYQSPQAHQVPIQLGPVLSRPQLQYLNTSSAVNMPFYLFTHSGSQDNNLVCDSEDFTTTVVKIEPNSEDEIEMQDYKETEYDYQYEFDYQTDDQTVFTQGENSVEDNYIESTAAEECNKEDDTLTDKKVFLKVKPPNKKTKTTKKANVYKRGRKPKKVKSTTPGTDNATRWGVKIFKDWLAVKNKSLSFEELPLSEINELFIYFYSEVQTKDGKKYSENALRCLKASLFRHLNSPPFNRNVDAQNIIWTSTSFLERKIRDEKEDKNEKQVKHFTEISLADLNKMYKSNVLGNDNPLSLLRKVWFELTLHFGGKTINSKKLTRQSFHLCFDENGLAYYKLRDDCDLPNDCNKDKRMFTIPDDPLCPVYSMTLYLSKLCPRNDSLFQCPIRKNVKADDEIWYCNQSVGFNRLMAMMSEISKTAKLSQHYTNRSVELTRISMLQQAGVTND